MSRVTQLVSVLLLASACGREAAEQIIEVPAPVGGSGGESGTDAAGLGGAASGRGVAGTSSTSDADGGSVVPKLTENHPGYRQPLCFDCHSNTAPYPHSSASYRPPDCVGCHGYNGAPHRDHAVVENPGCPDCHSTVAHVPKFVAPTDCIRCHFQK